MRGSRFGQRSREIGAQHPHQFHAGYGRHHQRCCGGGGHIEQRLRHVRSAGHDKARQFLRHHLFQRGGAGGGVHGFQVPYLGHAQHLDQIGMDEIQVPNETLRRILGQLAVKRFHRAVTPGAPLQLQP